MYKSKLFSFLLQVKYCLEVGISADSASTLFIFIGLASSFSRVVTGRMCDISWINTIFVYQFGNLLVGLITICLLLIKDYTGMVIFAIVYGVGDGIFITTMNSLLVFTVEEKRRASALGLGNFLLSLGIAGGPPLAGENIFLIQDILLFKSVFWVGSNSAADSSPGPVSQKARDFSGPKENWKVKNRTRVE